MGGVSLPAYKKIRGHSAESALSEAERARDDTRTRNAEQNLKSRADQVAQRII